MSDDRREQAFDEQVRAALAAPREAGVCPDAETLALYASQALAEEERAGVEPHLSLCVRCQDVLAVLATTEDVAPLVPLVGSGLESDTSLSRPHPTDPPAASTPWWHWRWLLPVPAAALAAALYFAVRPAPPVAPPAFEMAARDIGTNTDALIHSPAKSAEADQPLAAAPPPTRSGSEAGERATSAPRRTVADTERRARPTVSDEFGGRAVQGGAPALPAPPREMPTAPTVGRNEGQAPHEVPAAVRQEPLAAQSKATDATGRAGGGPPGSLLLPSPDEARFRIDPSGRLFSSPDLGRTWRPVGLPRPAILTTGQCTAPTTLGAPPPCWLAGRNGVILRTIDGTTWHAVPSPTARDIVTITTSAGERAVLTTADGVRFETTDAGATWRER